MVARVISLTSTQQARIPEYAARWIAAGLGAGPTERRRFEEAARRCYVYAGVPWHHRVVWVRSPLTLMLVVLLIHSRLHGAYPGLHKLLQRNVSRSLGETAWEEIEQALLQAFAGCEDPERLNTQESRLAAWAAGSEVSRAIVSTVRNAPAHELHRAFEVWSTVHPRVQRILDQGIQHVVQTALGTVGDAIDTAVDNAVEDLCEPEAWVNEALRHTLADATRPMFILKGAFDPFAPDPALFLPPFVPHPSFLSFLREVCGLELKNNAWDRGQAYEQTMCSAGWWYPHRDFVLVCERPRELHSEPGRHWPGALQLHNAAGPAVAWQDGWSIHAFHGCQVPGWILEHPEAISVGHIEHMDNAEVRRIMIQLYGWERYIRDCGARVVDSAPMNHPLVGLRGARLLRKDLPGEDEPLIYLDMVNSTPEPDGTYKHYFERISPYAYDGDAARLCHAAMASRWCYRDEYGQLQQTFQRWQDYLPLEES